MILSYPKSRMVFIVLISLTVLSALLILLLHSSGFQGENEILAVVVASLGFFISVSAARLIMNSEILSLRYMLANAVNLERCAEDLRRAAMKMRKRSEERFQTASQAADALSITGRGDEAIALLHSVVSANPSPERTTHFLLSALRYSLMKGDMEGAREYAAKAEKAIQGLGSGIGKGLYEREIKPFRSFLDGEETLLIHRFRTAENKLMKLEAAMLLRDSDDTEIRSECIGFISEPKKIE